jgi:transcriptional regulator with XRE-family HTH domain
MNQNGCQDGAAIRRLREDQRISAGDLADRVGIIRQSLYNIELGNKPAGLAVLVKIARELGVQVDEILLKDGEDAPAQPKGVAA